MNRRKKGLKVERIVCDYLKNLEYEILEQNYFCGKYGEIDIIAKKDNIIVFIEVRTLNKLEPSMTISISKIKKLEDCINKYVLENNIQNYKFEIVIYSNKKIVYHGEIDYI